MKTLFYLLVFICYHSIVVAQEISGFEMEYSSNIEEKNLNQFEEGTINYFELFTSIESNEDDIKRFRSEYLKIITELKTRISENYKPKKKIKLIYQYVHANYLRRYVNENLFSDVFTNGNYNCVSATALYAMIFKELGIDFNIKESPTHVFLVAYPKIEPIKIETTDPVYGYLQISEAYQKQFIKYLKENKLVTEADIRNTSLKELFNKFYFEENNISLSQLIGVQYSNDGIYKFNQKNYKESFNQLLKSKNFYESEKTKFLLIQAAANYLSESNLSDLEKLIFNIKLTDEDIIELDTDYVKYNFLKILKDLLIEEGKDKEADNFFYKYFYVFEEDSVLANEMSFLFNFEKGRIAYNTASYEKSLIFMQEALKLNPKHLDAQSLYAHAIIRKYNSASINDDMILELEKEMDKRVFLKDNNLYIAFLANTYLVAANRSFFYKNMNLEKGVGLVKKFEDVYSKDEHLEIQKELISNVFIEVSKYYFRKRNMTKVRYYLEKALEYNPNSMDAQSRMESYF